MSAEALAGLEREVVDCRRCPRLVEWREAVARERRAAFRDQEYWGRPAPGFGDPRARILLLGLAPAAHGANRTGRMFTGDRSGDFLYAALHRAGLANQPTSVHRDDGLELHDVWITASVRCAPPANKPLPAERDNCAHWLRREVALLSEVRVIVCLGAFAWDNALRLRETPPRPGPAGPPARGRWDRATHGVRPKFGHGAEWGSNPALLGCFHPSQQNTFTGKLTPAMIDSVFERAKELAR